MLNYLMTDLISRESLYWVKDWKLYKVNSGFLGGPTHHLKRGFLLYLICSCTF